MALTAKILGKALKAPIYQIMDKTELQHAKTLSKRVNNNIYLKREDTTPIKSFKLRGAYNKISSLSDNDKRLGIIACSAGNQAQGVAYSAQQLGIQATIVMPKVTPDIKLQAVKDLGAEVIIGGDDFDQCKKVAFDIQKRENKIFIHPYDDYDVIAGQGTIGLEIIQQIQEQNIKIDRVFCCIGGGGLAAGVGSIIKKLLPRVEIIGVEAEDQSAMTQSLKAGYPIELDSIGTYADGSAVKIVGEKTFSLCKNIISDMITVTNDQINRAIINGFLDTRTVLEPSGALAIAGATKYLKEQYILNSNNIVITSGANVDLKKIGYIFSVREPTEGYISVTIPEEIGSFKRLYDMIYPRAVTEFTYRYSNCVDHPNASESSSQTLNKTANILLGFKAHDLEDKQYVIESLKSKKDFISKLIDLEYNQLAKDHLLSSTVLNKANIPNEKLFRFHFPEYPGALNNFLNKLKETDIFNVTLFNYKNRGGDIGKVLVGIAPVSDGIAPVSVGIAPVPVGIAPNKFNISSYNNRLSKFLIDLNYTFFDETDNPLYKQFLTKK